jgi:hypothetical protein
VIGFPSRLGEAEFHTLGWYVVTSSHRERNHEHDWMQVRTERAGMIVQYDRCGKCEALRLDLPDLGDFAHEPQHAEFDWLMNTAKKR